MFPVEQFYKKVKTNQTNMSVLIEKYNTLKASSSTIAIKPFVDPSIESMGLEKYGMAVHEGIFHEEPLVCLEQHGVRRYVTGLNEFAPEITRLPQPEREAAVKEIRNMVVDLEARLAANVIKADDPDFWNKVKLLRPDNDEFWGKILLRVSNEPYFLSPAEDPYDLIKLRALQSGGFSMVAPSLEAARKSVRPPKFFLDRAEETAGIRTEVSKLRDEAGAELRIMYKKNFNKLLMVCKVVDPNSAQYRKSTPVDVLYENMTKHLNGEGVERSKRKAIEMFLNICELDAETLKIRAMVKDAAFYKIIGPRGDGFIYHLGSGTSMGRTTSDVVEFLKNPVNDEIFKIILSSVENYWNK